MGTTGVPLIFYFVHVLTNRHKLSSLDLYFDQWKQSVSSEMATRMVSQMK